MEGKNKQVPYGHSCIRANSSTVQKIKANRENIPIPVADLFAAQKTYVWIMRNILKTSLMIDVNKLDVIWIPQIEPIGSGKSEITISHALSGNCTNPLMEQSGVVAKAFGNVSESLALRVFPTSTHILGRDDTVLLPWEIEFSTNINVPADVMTIGILKIDCELKIRTFNHKKMTCRPYKEPQVFSSGLHFPCNKAAVIYKTPNKYSIGWSAISPQGTIWEKTIMPKVHFLMKNVEDKWKVQNLISYPELKEMRDEVQISSAEGKFLGANSGHYPHSKSIISSMLSSDMHSPYMTLEEIDTTRVSICRI